LKPTFPEIYELKTWKTWGYFAMALCDKNAKFQKLLANNDIDTILQLCEKRMSIDPLDALMFMWGYADKEYRHVGDML
tara:strand:- start:841 stop:1074 length:234 start_codon:yes stop_codon:yes gene_type:complete